MLYGLPAGCSSAAMPPARPVGDGTGTVGTRWVATVAYLAAARRTLAGLGGGGLARWSSWCSAVLVVRHRWRNRPAMCQSESGMAVHLITGDDESLLLTAVDELVHARSSATATGR